METINVVGIFSDSFWYIAPILVTLTTTVTGFLNQLFKVQNSAVKQILSWVVASLLSIAAWALNLIAFGNPTWLGVVALCVVTGLSRNGFYDIKTIKNFIKSWFPDKVTVKKED